MASIEALEILIVGGVEWDSFVTNSTELIDLTFAKLINIDLKNRRFHKCDLSGVNFDETNLDRSIFEHSILNGVSISNVSLVNCQFINVTATQLNMSNSVFREGSIVNSNFNTFRFNSSTIERCEISNSFFFDGHVENSDFTKLMLNNVSIESLYKSKLKILKCHFKNCILTDWDLSESIFTQCIFRTCELSNIVFTKTGFLEAEVSNCTIKKMAFIESTVNLIDFSKSIIKQVDIAEINPKNAILLNTSFVDCIWPKMSGRTTLFGSYIPSEHLLSQPIQDVIGVPPIKRREIADAQYLTKKIEGNKSFLYKFLFRLWGISSAFGQSVIRLTLWSLLIILLHTIGMLAIKQQLWGLHLPNLSLLITEYGEITRFYLGTENTDKNAFFTIESIIIVSAKVCGYINLGFWIAVASSKFNKLSS